MPLFTLIILVIFPLFNPAFAQHSFVLSGNISDAATGESLPGTAILVEDIPNTGCISNSYGFYSLTLPEGERPTGIVCECDLVALGVLHAVRSSGLSIPQDISVIGFDDIDMACHANPPLTTVSPPKREMGRLAVELLFHNDSTLENISDYTMIESPLVVRDSTGILNAKYQ